MRWLRELLTQLWARPDELIRQASADGELLVARLRMFVSAPLLLLPLIHGIGTGRIGEMLVGLAMAVLVNAAALLWLALARSERSRGWLPFATGAYDVSVTTLVLVLLTLLDPAAGLGNVLIWGFYLLAIAMTALRHDGRLTLFVGALAAVQYGLLALVVLASADSPGQLSTYEYGTISIPSVAQRLLLLALMTALTGVIVYRIQRLIGLSGRDGLTGLPNRAWLVQRMPAVYESLRRDGGAMTLALLDVDNFRRVNESAGHRDGDRAIRHIADTLREMLGDEEHLVRLGGQEFVLVLRCPIGSAWERIDRTRRTLSSEPFTPERGGDIFSLTFSGGLATWPQDGRNTPALLGVADRRLQAAKQAGRNRVLVRDP